MLNKKKILSCLLYVTIVLTIETLAIEVQPRRAADCAYLSSKIYCYGGYVKGSSDDDGLIMLDINKNDGKPFGNLINQWENVTPVSNRIVFGRRAFAQTVALPDGKSMMVQGGYNYKSTSIEDQNIVYNAETNAWSIQPNYYEAQNGGNRQIYYGTGVYVDSINSIAFYGGYQQHVQNGTDYVKPDGTKISGLTFNNSDGYINSFAGFYYLTLYDLYKNTWSVPAQTGTPTSYRISQTATYVPLSKKIYYFGGQYYNTTDSRLYTAYMDYVITYDTVSSSWKYVYSTSNRSPSQRTMHSTTLLPDGYNVLLYGGTFDGTVALMDYCYTFNIQTAEWTFHNLVAPAGTSAPRSHHSAVLIDNSTLGIFFGIDKAGNPTNDLLIMDVRDVSQLSFSDTYPINTNLTTSSTNTTSTNESASNNSATIGIAVGVSCGALAIIAAIVFYVLRKRKQRSRHQVAQASNNNHPHPETEMLEVDWDKIDGQYYNQVDPPQQFVQLKSQSQITTQTPNEYPSPEGSSRHNVSPTMTVTYTKPDIGN
ncbi:hypothetical protein EDC96DRAFT_530140 [Choanephora cucurbitarum]|nr:hypothetical protein EDC96DRAFT_530140 [Choanephora cucurbitarum]